MSKFFILNLLTFMHDFGRTDDRRTCSDWSRDSSDVVTRDVADYAIVAGVPARVVGDLRDRAEI